MKNLQSVAPVVSPAGNPLQLALGTGAFAVCFSVFGSVSAMMPLAKVRLHLTPVQTSIAIAVPVLLGSLGRIPLGILADRWGSRRVSLAVMTAAILGALALAEVSSFAQLVAVGFFVGISLASFASTIGLASGWYPPARQGLALGVYGAGNIGQSFAAFGAPVIARALGFRWGYWTFALLTAAWLGLFALLARDPPRPRVSKPLGEVLRPLRDRKSWVLGMYYFLTFGGFVAMAIYLPLLLTDLFGLTPQDAGLRTDRPGGRSGRARRFLSASGARRGEAADRRIRARLRAPGTVRARLPGCAAGK